MHFRADRQTETDRPTHEIGDNSVRIPAYAELILSDDAAKNVFTAFSAMSRLQYVTSMTSVCPSECNSSGLSVRSHASRISREPNVRTSRIFVNVACGTVLFWWRCSMLCTSGFVDDVMFFYNRPYGGLTLPQHHHWPQLPQPSCTLTPPLHGIVCANTRGILRA